MGKPTTASVPPMLLGESLVVQTPNHLQGVITADFFVARGDDLRFQDGSGLALGEKRRAAPPLEERRIGSAEQPDSGVSPADLAARKADRDTLKKSAGCARRGLSPRTVVSFATSSISSKSLSASTWRFLEPG
ncbi:MAG: hypothetical protein U0263_30615 [Polyangiaceae bacterium]